MDYIKYVIKAKQGDMKSCEYLINNFQEMAVGYAYSILHDIGVAEDAAQEAFILMLNNLNALKEPKAFISWLRKLIFSSCNRIIRNKKDEVVIDGIDELPDTKSDLQITSENNEKKVLINEALSKLSKTQQEAILLHYFFEKSYSDIAEYFGISEAAVANRLYYGKKRLKNVMLETMTDYLGGYKMDKTTFTKKVIEKIPAHPIGCESSDYIACFASLYMALENNEISGNHSSVYNKYVSVAGINALTYDDSMVKYHHDELAKVHGLDDYIAFTMGYAGYKYITLNKSESKDTIYMQIITSLNNDIPLLMETKYGWCILIGYDKDKFIYGYDGFHDGNFNIVKADKYLEDKLFVLNKWYEQMQRIIIVTGKQQPTITQKDIFERLSNIFDKMQDGRYDERLINKLLNDSYFDTLTEDEQKKLFMHSLNFLYHHVSARAELCWSISDYFYPCKSDKELNQIQSINGLMGFTHDLCWDVFRTLGNGGFEVNEEDFPKFLDPTMRHKVGENIKIISFNDYKTSCFCKMISGQFVSDLEQYLNEPIFSIPRNKVGPVEMGSYSTEIIDLTNTVIINKLLPIIDCNKNNIENVYLIDFQQIQGMFYYNTNIINVSYTIMEGDNYTAFSINGKYLKVTGILPISIYNICDSWYGTNNIKLDYSRKMIVKKTIGNNFESYIPIFNKELFL